MVTAVAYPMSSKFRTGLTLAMFALVIFTLIVMSILTNAFGRVSTDTDLFLRRVGPARVRQREYPYPRHGRSGCGIPRPETSRTWRP